MAPLAETITTATCSCDSSRATTLQPQRVSRAAKGLLALTSSSTMEPNSASAATGTRSFLHSTSSSGSSTAWQSEVVATGEGLPAW